MDLFGELMSNFLVRVSELIVTDKPLPISDHPQILGLKAFIKQKSKLLTALYGIRVYLIGFSFA